MLSILLGMFFTACGNTPSKITNITDEISIEEREQIEEIEPIKEPEEIRISEPLFKKFNTGFGTALTFPFLSVDNREINLELNDLLLDSNLKNNPTLQQVKKVNINAFEQVQKTLRKSKYLVFWLVDGWEESWFDKNKIQELMDAGYVPIFSYWYFGDKLIYGVPDANKIRSYQQDNIRLARFLSQLKGKKMIVMEPEFNKSAIIKDIKTQHEFSAIISTAIDTIKNKNPDLLVSISIMDKGIRAVYDKNIACGYENCALGDNGTWSNSETVIYDLLEKLDFISFHQMIGSFSRDYSDLGDWNHPNPRRYTDEEIGIDYLARRILNFSGFLHQKYKKPIFMPFITIATATWNDDNGNQQIESTEISPNRWEDKAISIYAELDELKPSLKENGLFGFAIMSLFDHPRQDYDGYQYFMNNEYHLGILGSSARDEIDVAPDGNLYFKGNILEYLFNNEE